ncbi:MAG TPA: DUF1837 domain-containing protein [Solirubrobacterales bacterium]
MEDAATIARLRADGVDPLVTRALDGHARGKPDSLSALLAEVGKVVELPGTEARCRCHFVERDGNGLVQVERLAERLAEEVVDYCIPRSRIAAARRYMEEWDSTKEMIALGAEARELFARVTPSGEGGELMLYLLLENLLRLPQLFCKMSVKTSAQMHVHGVDGVHGRLLDDGTLALYWGEAKLHAAVDSAIDECFGSLAPYLTGGQTGAAKRDLLLLRDNLDLADPDLEQALIGYFDRSDARSARIEFRGACLIGFDLDDYPVPRTPEADEIAEDVAEALARWHQRISGRIAGHSLEAIEIEVFCVPMPSVAEFRVALLERLS